MLFDFETFKIIVSILKNFNLDEVSTTLTSTRIHHERALNEYQQKMQELKQMLVNYKSYETELVFRGNEVQYYDIQNWIPIFKMHQKATIFPETKKQSVQRISKGKKEIDNLKLSIEEAYLRLKGKAKDVKGIYNSVRQLEAQIDVLEAATDVEGFLTSIGYKAGEIAEFELPKLYKAYQKAGEINGSV